MKPVCGVVFICMAEGRICRMAQAVLGKDQPSAMFLRAQFPLVFNEEIWYLNWRLAQLRTDSFRGNDQFLAPNGY